MNTIARCRFATSNSGRMFSASFFVRNPFPGTCAPTTPGSASARSNSAAAADISTSGSAANTLKRPSYFWQIPDSASLTILHNGSETSTGCDSIQQNEPSSDSTLVLTSWRTIFARWNPTSSNALDSGSSPTRLFSTSTPS
jgi:hypothetical protein